MEDQRTSHPLSPDDAREQGEGPERFVTLLIECPDVDEARFVENELAALMNSRPGDWSLVRHGGDRPAR